MRSIWPQIVVEHNQRSTWTHPLREHTDTPLGGRCSEMMELEGRAPTINTPQHLVWHWNRIHEKERFWFEEHRNRVRRYDTTWRWGSTQLGGSTTSRTERVRPKVGKESVYFHCMIRWDGNEMMSIYSGVCRIYSLSLYPPLLPLYFRTPAVAP